MRIIIVVLMACLLSGCGSIISRTIPGQGHGNQYYPGVKWDVRDSAWRYLTVLDLPFSLISTRCCCPSMPATARTSSVNQRSSHSSAAV